MPITDRKQGNWLMNVVVLTTDFTLSDEQLSLIAH